MSRRWLGLVALVLYACNSTGVGNPAPASLQLAITRDDVLLAPAGGVPGAAGATAYQPDSAGADGAELATANGGAAVGDGGAAGVPGVASDGGSAPGSAAGAGAGSPGADTALPRAAIHDAVLVIGEVRFLPCDSRESAAVAVGPFFVDLVHGGTLPTIPAVSVPAGGFCGLDAPLAPAKAPSRLVGRSVYFDGERADGTPFRFYANLQATLRVRARAGVSWGVDERPVRSVFWALRPRQWLEPGELNALEATLVDDGSGVFSVDVERHPGLLRAIRSRLAGRSTLYDDANDDDAFGADDRDAVLGDGVPNAD